MNRKICVVTGTRAEYGLLYWLMKEIDKDPELELQIIVTGMHLSPEFGLTYKQIEKDGFLINEKVEMLLSSDTASSVAKSIGIGTIGFSDSLSRLKPELLIVLGDRFETFSAVQTALIMNIPIAHIHGGEVTYGAYDDSIRHAITKMSYLHFVTTEEHRKRVIRLGEHPTRVYNVGAPGIENIMKLELISKEKLEEDLNVELKNPIFLITHHPTTLSKDPLEGTSELLEALNCYEGATIIFTKANADNNGRIINSLIKKFVEKSPSNRKIFNSLGQVRYLSLLKISDLVIGNSSSGLLEAPYLKTATVNIGNRQKGRARPASIFDAMPNANDIKNSIETAMLFKFGADKEYKLFGNGNTAKKIKEIIKSHEFKSMKEFYDGEII